MYNQFFRTPFSSVYYCRRTHVSWTSLVSIYLYVFVYVLPLLAVIPSRHILSRLVNALMFGLSICAAVNRWKTLKWHEIEADVKDVHSFCLSFNCSMLRHMFVHSHRIFSWFSGHSRARILEKREPTVLARRQPLFLDSQCCMRSRLLHRLSIVTWSSLFTGSSLKNPSAW